MCSEQFYVYMAGEQTWPVTKSLKALIGKRRKKHQDRTALIIAASIKMMDFLVREIFVLGPSTKDDSDSIKLQDYIRRQWRILRFALKNRESAGSVRDAAREDLNEL